MAADSLRESAVAKLLLQGYSQASGSEMNDVVIDLSSSSSRNRGANTDVKRNNSRIDLAEIQEQEMTEKDESKYDSTFNNLGYEYCQKTQYGANSCQQKLSVGNDESPNLRALLQRFDEQQNRKTDTRSVLYKYLKSSRLSYETNPDRKHFPGNQRINFPKPSATISSPDQLEAQEIKGKNVTEMSRAFSFDFRQIDSADSFSQSSSGQHHEEKTNTSVTKHKKNEDGGQNQHKTDNQLNRFGIQNPIPSLSLIGDVVDSEFEIQRNNKPGHSASPVWIKEEPEWDMNGSEIRDPKAAYILQNLRAGLLEQKNKAEKSQIGQNLDGISTRSKLNRKRVLSNQIQDANLNYSQSEYAAMKALLRLENDGHHVTIEQPESKSNNDNKRMRYNSSPKPSSYQSPLPLANTEITCGTINGQLPTKDASVQCELLTEKSKAENSLRNDVTPAYSSRAACVIREAQEGLSMVSNDNADHNCAHCNISFNDAVLHSIHMGCHNLNTPFLCNVCGIQCDDKYGFYTHIMRGHHAP